MTREKQKGSRQKRHTSVHRTEMFDVFPAVYWDDGRGKKRPRASCVVTWANGSDFDGRLEPFPGHPLPYIYIESTPCCLSALAPCLSQTLSLFVSLSLCVRAVLLVTRERASLAYSLSLSLSIGTFQTLYPISSLYRLSFFSPGLPLHRTCSSFLLLLLLLLLMDVKLTKRPLTSRSHRATPPLFFPILKQQIVEPHHRVQCTYFQLCFLYRVKRGEMKFLNRTFLYWNPFWCGRGKKEKEKKK